MRRERHAWILASMARPEEARCDEAATALAAASAAMASTSAAGASAQVPDAAVTIDPQPAGGGEIAPHFVGVSIEWSLIDRYMGPTSRPGFAKLLGNLGSGLLRIGGS
jgi:hypothetical protein